MRISLIVLAGTLLGASLVAAPQTTRLADTSAAGAAATATFYKDVLPVLQKNCQSCHRPGEVAPMSLLTYEQARPWARAIKTADRQRSRCRPGLPIPRTDISPTSVASARARSKRSTAGSMQARRRATRAMHHRALAFENGWNIKPDIVVEMPKAFADSGLRHHQLQVRGGQRRVHRGPLGERRGDAARQPEGAASRQGLGAAAGIELDDASGLRRGLRARNAARDHGRQRDRGRQRHPRQVQSRPRRAALRHRRRRQVHPQGLRPRLRAALHDVGRSRRRTPHASASCSRSSRRRRATTSTRDRRR